MYADDTTLVFKDHSLTDLISVCNSTLRNFNIWCRSNRLSVNVQKSKALFISNRISSDAVPHIYLCNQILQFEEEIRFLGVYVDKSLKFSSLIKYIRNKMSKNIGIFYKLRSVIDRHSLVNLYIILFIHI